MVPGTSGASGTTYPIPGVQTFEAFTVKKTSCVRAVLEKTTTFGFSVKDVILGYKMEYIQDSRNRSFIDLSGRRFIFKELSTSYLITRRKEVIQTYLKAATIEKFKETYDAEPLAPEALIDKAFAYDDFIRIKAKELRHAESFSAFLERVEENNPYYSVFLQQIASAMSTKPEINPEEDGEYLVALWVELSNAMAMKIAGKSKDYSKEPLKWGNWSSCKHRGGQDTYHSDTEGEMRPSSNKKIRKDTIDTPCAKSPESSDSKPVFQRNEGSSGTENFVDHARWAGKTETEITIMKASFLANQAKNNLELLLRQQTETGQKIILEQDKRKLVRTLSNTLSTVNGLKTSSSR